MNAPRLLFAFALAFVLGAIGIIGVQYQRHATTSATQAANAEQTDRADTDGDGRADQDDAPAWPDNAPTPEQVLYAQPQMLQDAIAKLLPRAVDKVNAYLVAFAGDGSEEVFRNEAEYADKVLAQRFGLAGHDLLLINNPATLTQYPVASLSNLEAAIKAVAERMNRDEDVLLLFLTSHGSRDHELYVNMDPLPLDQIGVDDLAGVLSKSDIRHKVIVISACYSGGFIDALKDDTTMVITAARSDRASFGCGSQSEITDFGRAFFVEGLNHNDSFAGAFAEAKRLIDEWETRDNEEHSFPQLVTTPQIETKLKAWRSGLSIGAPVPFTSPIKAIRSDSLIALRYAVSEMP